MQHLVYLHGFLSSPQSVKAQQTLAYVKKHLPSLSVHAPVLSGSIAKTKMSIEALMSTLPKGKVGFIGSSMGGFLATYCCEKYGGKAVLVNPAVAPYNLMSDYLGKHQNPNTGEIFWINQAHLNLLKQMDVNLIKQAANYLVMLQTGDETLDYSLAHKKYHAANLIIEQGGNHSFVDFDRHLDLIFDFLR